MIWHYFPIGMRFPVRDFSETTKRACWEIALSAAFASDARGTQLYEACETFDQGSEYAVYTCIVCYEPIEQSRTAGKTMHGLDRLMTRLCLHDPLVQANYLERFGPYPPIGEIDANGTVIPAEAGEAFLPTEGIGPMQRSEGWELLFVCDREADTRTLGAAAAENGFRVRRLLLADGRAGAVHALVSGTNGRYETVLLNGADGVRTSCTVGVIPGRTAVLETYGVAPEQAEELVRGVLDFGYRKLLIVGDGTHSFLGITDDPRFHQSEITFLSDHPEGGPESVPAADWILDRVDFASRARTADFTVVCTDRRKTAEAVLPRLIELGRACCLISGPECDPNETGRAYPTLRGTVRRPDSGDCTEEMFCTAVLPLIGNGVAKTDEL